MHEKTDKRDNFEMTSYLAVKDCNDKEQWRLLEFDSMDELLFSIYKDKEAPLYQILKQCEYKILQEVTGDCVMMRDDSLDTLRKK